MRGFGGAEGEEAGWRSGGGIKGARSGSGY